jgi:hypothetical protein
LIIIKSNPELPFSEIKIKAEMSSYDFGQGDYDTKPIISDDIKYDLFPNANETTSHLINPKQGLDIMGETEKQKENQSKPSNAVSNIFSLGIINIKG